MADPVFATPPSVVTTPPRQWGPEAPPDIYSDPDVLVLDSSFSRYLVGLTALRRVATGFDWAEGPSWNSMGQYLVFSDVKGNVQYKYSWDTGKVSAFRVPSFNSNGNAFDFAGRQVSAQDFFRRVVRWEHDGSMTIIADNYNGTPLNSPNDFAHYPDGSIWFTDPYFGGSLSEGHPNQAGGRGNTDGFLNPFIGNPGSGIIGGLDQTLPAQTYRWDPNSHNLSVVVPNSAASSPNGLCFSPDYKLLYLISGGKILVGDVTGHTVHNVRTFSDCIIDTVHCSPDGIKCDTAGNVWASSNAPLGYCGATVWNPAGTAIGRIRLPEVCANLTFGGPKRDYLLMTASQSLYMLRVNIQGAAPG
jgi:gluconolactonase